MRTLTIISTLLCLAITSGAHAFDPNPKAPVNMYRDATVTGLKAMFNLGPHRPGGKKFFKGHIGVSSSKKKIANQLFTFGYKTQKIKPSEQLVLFKGSGTLQVSSDSVTLSRPLGATEVAPRSFGKPRDVKQTFASFVKLWIAENKPHQIKGRIVVKDVNPGQGIFQFSDQGGTILGTGQLIMGSNELTVKGIALTQEPRPLPVLGGPR